ncbi:Protein let-653 [Caenorhabditis elegans]|uniref:Isoform c of Protein let-653 n=1 Tax=Caenorhabditis elegans TaxID=6239 RepID=Q27394-3|nr:Protein let-653 [Caenorhabditis elegans]CAA62505.1 let-653 [Caenorhabditis elegans]CCD31038.1 Protein let-653 [Caenorhabditis elegans]|eukprot:NP_001255594.1 Protein let-653 [Caenorhabditis elegans]
MRHPLISLLLLIAFYSTSSEAFVPKCNSFYVRWPRVRLNFKAVAEARLSLKGCQSACSLGEDPVSPGKQLECAAVNHQASPDGFSHLCAVFQPHQLQNVDGYVEADDRFTFYWKYCLPSTRKCSGEYAFTYLSDRYMDQKSVIKWTTKANLEECLSDCLDEKSFECRSISFNRTDGGCHMSKDSQISRPEAIRLNNNPNYRIDYYENNCYNLSESFTFKHECRDNGISVSVKSRLPYTGAIYGLYDFFTCRTEPKEATEFDHFFPYQTVSKNCSDSIKYKGNEMVLEVVLSTDGIEPLYFITPEDLTYQAKCPISGVKAKDPANTKSSAHLDNRNKAMEASAHALFELLSKTGDDEALQNTFPLPLTTTTEVISDVPTTTVQTSTTVPTTPSKTTATTTTTPKPTTTETATTSSSTTTVTTQKPTTVTSTTTLPSTTASTTTKTTTSTPTSPQTTTTHVGAPASSVASVAHDGSTLAGKPKVPVIFDIFHNGQPVEAVVVGTKISLSFRPHYPIPPEYVDVRGCQVEPIDPKYEWEHEPLFIIRDGCPADGVGLVCPPTHSEFGAKVSVEAFRYQTTGQVQYSCLVRICPFAPCPKNTCDDVEGCDSSYMHRYRRELSLEDIKKALEANPELASQFGISPSAFARNPSKSKNFTSVVEEQQRIALGGDYLVRRRLIVVNSEDQLRYYVRTGNI